MHVSLSLDNTNTSMLFNRPYIMERCTLLARAVGSKNAELHCKRSLACQPSTWASKIFGTSAPFRIATVYCCYRGTKVSCMVTLTRNGGLGRRTYQRASWAIQSIQQQKALAFRETQLPCWLCPHSLCRSCHG